MPNVTVTILPETYGEISPRLYGHFAEHLGRCCYGGLWAGRETQIGQIDGFRADVVYALRAVGVPVLRWPGGCHADHYHWRDGIGPNRRRTLGMSCGLRVPDDNSLGTHEFLRLCELIGAEPYLAANVGTGTPQELCDWVEYVNSPVETDLTRERRANGHAAPWDVRLWGVGNESWDCGGRLDPVSYARELRRYATLVRHVDPGLELVAVGLDDDWPHGSPDERDWNSRVLETLGGSAGLVDNLSIHRYWIHGGPGDAFDEEDYYTLLAEAEATGTIIERAAATIRAFPAARNMRVALDEWGVWHPEARDWGPGARVAGPAAFEQPATLRDALAAAIAFEEFHRHSQVLSMANLAQVVNVLQAMLLTDGESLVRTPTYYAFALHRPHRGAEAHAVEVDGSFGLPGGRPAVSATASESPDGMAVTVVNRHYREAVSVCLRGCDLPVARADVLAASSAAARNTAADPESVAPAPLHVERTGGDFVFTMPAHAMATLQLGQANGGDGGVEMTSGASNDR